MTATSAPESNRSDGPNFVVRLATSSVVAGILDELLAATDLQFSLWDDVDDDRAVFSFYANDESAAAALGERLDGMLAEWAEFLPGGCELGEPTALPREDWAESWKRHFRCTQVSPRIVVTPSWERELAPAVAAIVQVDPGMAFGTGLHGTSQACLKLLDEATGEAPTGTLYDVGCGTGILAIAASKLGWRRVLAIDLCGDAVAATRENLAINGCTEGVTVAQADLGAWDPGGQSPLVLVNVLAPIIVAHAARLAGWVAPGGALVVSGILTEQFPEVIARFGELGFTLEREITIDKWTSGRLRRGG